MAFESTISPQSNNREGINMYKNKKLWIAIIVAVVVIGYMAYTGNMISWSPADAPVTE